MAQPQHVPDLVGDRICPAVAEDEEERQASRKVTACEHAAEIRNATYTAFSGARSEQRDQVRAVRFAQFICDSGASQFT